MKRTQKLLCLLLALVLVSGAALAAVLLSPEGDETEGDPGVSVLSLDADSVTQLGWTYEEESLSFLLEDDTWVYAEDSTFPLSTSRVEAALSALCDLTASRTIEEAEDLAQYGLEEPTCTVEVTAGDTTTQLLIGDETTMGGERYLSTGDGNVYLVDEGFLDNFQYGLYDLVVKETIPSMDDVVRFTVEAETQTLDLYYLEDSGLAYSDEYVWFAASDGTYTALDSDLTQDLIEQVTLLSWGDCVDYKAGDEALAEYGLAEPAATVTVQYIETVEVETDLTDDDGNPIYDTQENEETFVLEIGSYTGSSCYARLAGSEMVYLIDATVCDSLLYTTADSLLPQDILLMDWDTVDSIDVTVDGATYTVVKSVQEVTDDDGSTSEETVWTLDGEEVALTSLLSSLNSLDSAGAAPTSEPQRSAQLSFLFHRNTETFPEVELIFYEYDSTTCLVSLNGEIRLTAAREDVDGLAEDFLALLPE